MTDFLSWIRATEDEIEKRKQELSLLKSAACEAHCPLPVGSKVEIPSAAYSFVGKPALVERVALRNDGYFEKREFQWRITARIIRKDGTLGDSTASWNIPVKS